MFGRFITGRDRQQETRAAVTPEGKSLGFEWRTPATPAGWEQQGHALLWPSADDPMASRPIAGIDQEHSAAEWKVNGMDEGHATHHEAMEAAENDASACFTKPLAEASESFFARAAEMIQNREAPDRDAERGFDMER